MALIACTECAREISTLAVSCPGCGVPLAHPIQSAPPVQVPLPPANRAVNANLPIRITERLHSKRTLTQIKELVGQRFHAIEPKFQTDKLEFSSKHALLLRATVTPTESKDVYLLVVEHTQTFMKASLGLILAQIVLLGLLWYFLNLWLALGFFAFALIVRFNRKFSEDNIRQCVQNIKNEVA